MVLLGIMSVSLSFGVPLFHKAVEPALTRVTVGEFRQGCAIVRQVRQGGASGYGVLLTNRAQLRPPASYWESAAPITCGVKVSGAARLSAHHAIALFLRINPRAQRLLGAAVSRGGALDHNIARRYECSADFQLGLRSWSIRDAFGWQPIAILARRPRCGERDRNDGRKERSRT